MKITDILEGSVGELSAFADDIIDQLAGERNFNYDTIMRLAKRKLEKLPQYKDPKKMQRALAQISRYVKPEAMKESTTAGLVKVTRLAETANPPGHAKK